MHITITTDIDDMYTLVDTIAQLQALSGATYPWVRVRGYYAANDGGGGDFVYNATSTAIENGGTVLYDSTTGTGRYLRENSTEYVDIAVFGADGTGVVDASANITAAASSGVSTLTTQSGKIYKTSGTINFNNLQVIHKGTFSGSGTLLLSGTALWSGKQSGKIIGTCKIRLDGGADQTVDGLFFSSTDTYALFVSPSADISRLRITNNSFLGTNYAILRQHSVGNVIDGIVSNNIFANLTADAIEWNVAVNDTQIVVESNVIDGIDYKGTELNNWGIGIGFAGITHDALYLDCNMIKNFTIRNNKIRNVCQGIHVEAGKNFSIHGNQISDVSSALSAHSGLTPAAIMIYGSSQFSISDNLIVDSPTARSISLEVGAIDQVYLAPCLNYDVTDNVTINSGIIASYGAGPGYARLVNNRACIRHYGAVSQLVLSQNIGVSAVGSLALEVDFNSSQAGVTAFNQKQQRSLAISGNKMVDVNDQPSYSLINIAVEEMFDTGDNDFPVDLPLSSALTNIRAIPRVLYVNTVGTFPYGIELVKGDTIIDNDSGAMWQVTTGGSRNRALDYFTVYDQINKIVKSSNLPWTMGSGGNHEFGQQVTLSNIGAAAGPLVSSVLRVYVSSGSYLIQLADPITAVNGTAGLITATNPISYRVVQSGRVPLVITSNSTLSADSGESIIGNSTTAITLGLTPVPYDGETHFIKNANTGILTISSSIGIDSTTSVQLTQYESCKVMYSAGVAKWLLQ